MSDAAVDTSAEISAKVSDPPPRALLRGFSPPSFKFFFRTISGFFFFPFCVFSSEFFFPPPCPSRPLVSPPSPSVLRVEVGGAVRSRCRRARRAGLPAPFLCLQCAGNVLAAFAGAAEPRRSTSLSLPPFLGTVAGHPAAEGLGEPWGYTHGGASAPGSAPSFNSRCGSLTAPSNLCSARPRPCRGMWGEALRNTHGFGGGGAVSVVELLPKSGVGGWLLFRSCARLMREGRLLWRCYPWSVWGGQLFFWRYPPEGGGGYLRFRYCPVLGVTISEVRGSRR